MGAFNTVRGRVECPSCRNNVEVVAQFKYGDTWQHEYLVGDRLKWGGNQIGQPGAKRVIVDAVAEKCTRCGYQGEWNLYLIVENDVVTGLIPASGKYDFGREPNTFVVEEP
jgi:hypothetical protein